MLRARIARAAVPVVAAALSLGCGSGSAVPDAMVPSDAAPEVLGDTGKAKDAEKPGKDAKADSSTKDAAHDAHHDAGVDGADTGADVRTDTGADSSGDGSSDAGPASCVPGGSGMTNCGAGGKGTESCCKSLAVTGGTFDRSYDAVTYTDSTHTAAVSGFRLDRYEITVGRFRRFVAAVVGGWVPAMGSGKHAHLNGGSGLSATGGGNETGWDSSWTSELATNASAWTTNLSCDPKYATWTSTAGSNESAPINCATWYEAYAFCIWDGGFLPSEAEWNYAAAGGGGTTGQRVYPWSSPSTSTTAGCSYANLGGATWPSTECSATGANNVGSESPMGDGAFGQADLAGNLWEWTLDWNASSYVVPCTDCANLTSATARAARGGSFLDDVSPFPLVSDRGYFAPTVRFDNLGARCARVP